MCRPARWLIHFSLSVATSLRHAINLWSSCRRLLVGFGFTEFFCGSNFVSKPCPGHWIPSYWVLPGFQVLWCRYPFEAELSMIGSRFYLVLCFFTEFESLPRILLATVVSGEKGLLRRSRRRFRSTRPQGYAVCFCRSMGWFSFCPPPPRTGVVDVDVVVSIGAAASFQWLAKYLTLGRSAVLATPSCSLLLWILFRFTGFHWMIYLWLQFLTALYSVTKLSLAHFSFSFF